MAFARRKLTEERHDLPALLRQAIAELAPASVDWIQKRLNVLWKSTTPTNNMEARAWLHETGRLIKHLPQDILAVAIDEAVRRSERNFTPAAGAILAIAEPMMKERQTLRDRLDILVNGPRTRKRYPWEKDREIDFDPADLCTPEEAAAIKAQFGLDEPMSDRDMDIGRDCSALRQPTAAELEEIAKDFKAKHFQPAQDGESQNIAGCQDVGVSENGGC